MKQAFRLVWSSLPLAFRLDPGAPGVSPSLGGLDGALSLRSLDGPSPSLKDAESDPEHGKLIGPWLVEIAASEPQAGLPAALSASTIAKHWDAALVGLLVLGIGLGLLIGWRRSPERRKGGAPRRDGLLPPQGVHPRTPHERLHDPVYLRRMLEAELRAEDKRDDSHPSP